MTVDCIDQNGGKDTQLWSRRNAIATEETTPFSASATPSAVPAAPASATASNPQPDCAVLPEGGFLTIWQSDPQLQATLGCSTSGHPRTEPAAWQVETSYQPFQHGTMIWSNKDGWFEQPLVFVLYEDGTYERFQDTFDPGMDPVSGGDTPPEGLFEPKFGFGKVWRQEGGVRNKLGWAIAEESTGTGRYQIFDMQHRMVWISQTNETYLFLAGGAVRTFDIPF